ncbi:MAG: hypothetical protein EP326_12665 [Deltaproteobacteria bacterium]|nr:MAG: hypothetical protein EP326_12665 [Deltaproteobacteria bacterium]TNF25760.1 MAG: hypothetical protein EP319_15505 [Deltaproteobacteria bacterium]
MKRIFFALSLFLGVAQANSVFDAKFGGTLHLDKKFKTSYKEVGMLTIEASSLDGNKVIARTSYKNPIFPQAFVLTPKHSLPPGMPLKRPFVLKASLKVNDQIYSGSLSTKELDGKGRYDVNLTLNQEQPAP